jgi:hypothetical protein
MTGGNSPRRKGYNAEREVVNICKAHGIEARRTPSSKYPDCWIDDKPVSVKRRKNGLKWAYEELQKHDYILFRADTNKWLRISYWTLERDENNGAQNDPGQLKRTRICRECNKPIEGPNYFYCQECHPIVSSKVNMDIVSSVLNDG